MSFPDDIIRQNAIFSYEWAAKNGDSECEKLVAKTELRALEMAGKLGWTNLQISKYWDLGMIQPMEYPMRLLGPGAPQINSYKDVWKNDFRDNPIAEYQIVIRNMDSEAHKSVK